MVVSELIVETVEEANRVMVTETHALDGNRTDQHYIRDAHNIYSTDRKLITAMHQWNAFTG